MSDGARLCGECTVCCTVLAIETAELRKQPGITCAHCTASGCAIHATRFPICRSYFCGWFGFPELDDSWRPDRSGVLLSPREHNGREGVELMLLTGEAALKPKLLAFVAAALKNAMPLYLAVPGPVGHYPARVYLNDVLARANRDIRAIEQLLRSALEAARKHRFQPMTP